MEGWELRHALPDGLEISKLERGLAQADQANAPATVEAFAVAMDKLFRFARVFQIGGDGDIAERVQFYRSGLADLPADLVALAVERATHEWTWGNRLPLPAEIKAFVSSEMAERHRIRTRILMAAERLRDEQDKKARAIAAQARTDSYIAKLGKGGHTILDAG